MWIRVETNVAENDKIHCFANVLGLSVECTLGFLIRTWGKVAEHRTDGDLGGVLDSTIEAWAAWRGEQGQYATEFKSHFVSDCTIDGWSDMQGKLIARQSVDKLRKRQERLSIDSPKTVRGQSVPTKRNETKLKIEKKKNTHGSQAEHTKRFNEEFWPAYPRRTGGEGKAEARKAFVALVIKDRVPVDLLIKKAIEYNRYCVTADRVGTPYVKMAASWLRKSRGWEEDWDQANGRSIQELPLLNAEPQ